ncbi:MAG: HDOD domain-containing protein [Rhodospirillaceae bacterium]|nr:HDOD domain-containing protein [Rhodospirillaceae bacterium]
MKLSILFIDDDVNLLRGLRRILHKHREDWDITFMDSPLDALRLLEEKGFDVVVSDMRMPEMDGASLLSEVEKRYPGTVRVVLSGYTEEKSVLRTIGPTHQYLAKPCNTEDIVSLLDRTLALRGVLRSEPLRTLAASLHNLPSPSALYMRLTAEMRKETSSMRTIAGMISEDVAMTAEVLRITNSAYFSLGSQVHDVFQAVRLLGLETVRALVLSVGIFRQFDKTPELSALVHDLDVYGLTVAALARRFAREEGLNDGLRDQAFCAGMLSVIGTLVFFDAEPRKTKDVLRRAERGEDLSTVEKELFGASQAELGGYLLGLWGFNDAIIEAVLYQDHPSACVYTDRSALTCVHMARAFGPRWPLGERTMRPVSLDVDYVRCLGMEAKVKAWMVALVEQDPEPKK